MTPTRPAALLAVLLLSVRLPAAASDSGAYQDWTAGRKAEALAEWRRLADQGDALAEYNLAACYIAGDGVRQSREIAIDWLRKSADGGYVKSMELLGTMLMSQNGFVPNYAEALARLSKAALAGSRIANTNLATLYLQGLGVPVDLPRARRYAEQAGDSEETRALLAEIDRRMALPQRAAVSAAAQPVRVPPAPPAASGAPEPGWFAHLASVSSAAEAAREWHRLQKLFARLAGAEPLFVQTRLASGAEVTRILVAGFADRDAALRFCQELKNSNCLAVRKPDYH